jgi:hypothetical protein
MSDSTKYLAKSPEVNDRFIKIEVNQQINKKTDPNKIGKEISPKVSIRLGMGTFEYQYKYEPFQTEVAVNPSKVTVAKRVIIRTVNELSTGTPWSNPTPYARTFSCRFPDVTRPRQLSHSKQFPS